MKKIVLITAFMIGIQAHYSNIHSEQKKSDLNSLIPENVSLYFNELCNKAAQYISAKEISLVIGTATLTYFIMRFTNRQPPHCTHALGVQTPCTLRRVGSVVSATTYSIVNGQRTAPSTISLNLETDKFFVG